MSTAGRYPIRTPRAYAFDAAYATVPNWDIGRPQRAFAYLADADLVRSPVLEVGCGTGELPMFLARRGHTVLGIDISPNAIEQARSKAHWRRIPAEFLLWDALELGGLADAGLSFATVVDCAMFHIFSDEERDRFIEGMARVLEPGGAYFVLGDARIGGTFFHPRGKIDGQMPTVRTNDIETYYERRGDGPPIVFIHGAIVDHSQWTPQVDALAGEYTTIAYDVRGHGRTGGSGVDPYSVELFVEDLEALLAALDVDRPVLCGLSMGGCIAQLYAASHLDDLAGLVLADTFTPEHLDWRDRLQFLGLKATVPPVRLVGYERVEQVMVWLQERIQGEGVSGDYQKIEQLREAAPKMATDEFAKVIQALTRFHATEIDYSTLTVPTLVLYGEHDAGFIRRHSRKLGTDLPNATTREVPDGGHASNLDNPEYFTAALEEFLADLVG